MQVSIPKTKIPLRRSRSSRFRTLYPVRQRQSQLPSWRLVAAAAIPLAALVVVALVARRRFFQGVALLASAVEEVADTVEDAAEDLAEAAEARAKRGEAGD
jgi:C4-dicarboxylate-specific signal transduction histidine kinase